MAEEVSDDRLQSYLDAISAYEREFKSWEGRVDKILKRYRDEKRNNDETRQTKCNFLWANIQTLVPACFSRIPQPDVTRRFRDNDPVGRVAALILERALEYEVQHYKDYRKAMKQAVRARFLGGRGIAWARYEPHFKAGPDIPEDGVQVTEDTEEKKVNEQLDYECAPTDYVNWKDFGHSVARTWDEVNLVWRKVYMNKKGVTKRFGEKIAKKIPYDASPTEETKKASRETGKTQALIYELWDKEEGVAVWLSKSYDEFLDEREDPLGFEGFFPCPEPLYASMTEDTLIPVPDFTQYQDQANSLDTLADRIHGLCEMLQLKGVYDSSADSSLSRLFTEGRNGTLLAVKNWAAFAEKNGLKGQIDIYDLTPLAGALKAAVEAFVQKKAEMDELSGVIDVLRGDVDPQEKLGQTEMKGQYASLRLRDKQQDVAEFATSLLQLKAQIICTKFSPATIAAMAAVDQLSDEDKQHVFLMQPGQPDPMTGQPGPPQPVLGEDGKPQPLGPAMELLVGKARIQDPSAEAPNPLRSFRIEVNADTLVQIDENAEKQAATEFLNAVGMYLEKAAMVGQAAPQLIPLILELLKWGISRYKVGKTVEGQVDAVIEQLKKLATQPPPPDPKVEAEKAKAEAAKEKAQMDVQVAQQKAGIDERKMQMEEQHDMRQMQIDGQMQQQDMAMQGQQMQMKQQQMSAQHQQKMQQAMNPPTRKQ